MSPPKLTTGPCWNSSEIEYLMNSHRAFLFLVDLNIGNPPTPTGVPGLVFCGQGTIANCWLIWLWVSGMLVLGQMPAPNMPRLPAAAELNAL